MRINGTAVRVSDALPYGTATLAHHFNDGSAQVATNCGHDVRLALVNADGELVYVAKRTSKD